MNAGFLPMRQPKKDGPPPEIHCQAGPGGDLHRLRGDSYAKSIGVRQWIIEWGL